MAGSKVKKTDVVDKITCNKCERELSVSTNYYRTYSDFFQVKGILPVCKKCLQEYYDNLLELNENEVYITVIDFFRTFDLYFSDDLFEMAIKERETWMNKGRKKVPEHWSLMLGKLNSMSKYRGLTWIDCKGVDVYAIDKVENEKLDILNAKDRARLKEKWGDSLNDKALLKHEKFFDDMKRMYRIETPQHVRALMRIVKMEFDMDNLLEEGDINSYEKMSKVHLNTLTASGLRPIDKKSSADSSGMINFSNMFENIEQYGFIKPSKVEEDQDIVDYSIMYLENYLREIAGQEKLTEPPSDTPKVKDHIDKKGDEDEL